MSSRWSSEDPHRTEDAAIRGIVARQESIGLQAITDGELRRDFWHLDFMKQLDGVTLEFTPDALTAIAKHALSLGSGARGLRSVTERLMMDVMFEIPSRSDIEKVVVTARVVEAGEKPDIILRQP